MISVLIPTIGRDETLCRAIESALAIRNEVVSEIVVLDNSQDEDFLNVLVNRVSEYDDSRLTVQSYTERLDMASSWNKGLDFINCPWVLYLHDDDELIPDVFNKVDLSSFSQYEKGNVAFVAFDYIFDINGKRQKSLSLQKSKSYSNLIRIIKDCPKFVSTVINVKNLKAIGAWDVDAGYFLDLLAFIKLAQNYPVVFIEKTIGVYYLHETNYSALEKRNQGYGDQIPHVFNELFPKLSAVERVNLIEMTLNFVYPKQQNLVCRVVKKIFGCH